jgi:aryl-alcohol dehydrogenase-like predicted oxidoreductase
MNTRRLGKTGFNVTEISLGTWQAGGRWGEAWSDENAEAVIRRALDLGVNFIDTADVYGGGKSEAACGRTASSMTGSVRIATKCGRALSPHTAEAYTPAAMTAFVEKSLRNMGRDTLDLIQLHCPPTPVYYRPEIFGTFERLREQGKIRNLGVSVEKIEEALKAIEYPNVRTVQIIFNMFRQRPAELFFREAALRDIGVIVRVPLASGLLTGAIRHDTVFGAKDHRAFNRDGAVFDRGETFSGVPLEAGLAAVDKLKTGLGTHADGLNLAGLALRWILMFPAVSCVIPGASRPGQVEDNLKGAELPALTDDQMATVRQVYDRHIRIHVHQQW